MVSGIEDPNTIVPQSMASVVVAGVVWAG